MLSICPTCSTPVILGRSCPECGALSNAAHRSRVALLLGLGLSAAGCVESKALYGVAISESSNSALDADGDGYDSLVDCDDNDAAIHPDAEETEGDGKDSNCDGSDDT